MGGFTENMLISWVHLLRRAGRTGADVIQIAQLILPDFGDNYLLREPLAPFSVPLASHPTLAPTHTAARLYFLKHVLLRLCLAQEPSMAPYHLPRHMHSLGSGVPSTFHS